ncbi:MAG: tetratricopeptide repeat protein [Planctomycetota bacterium]|jgi:tetratricopeptide (TPR) repeat protein
MNTRPSKNRKSDTKPRRDSNSSSDQQPLGKIGLLAGLIIVVAAIVTFAHWPALSAKAYSFDDTDYLTENWLVQNPGWNSASHFLFEVLEPSTVHGYYQPLTMISLMLDHALGGRTDNLRPFHRTSLMVHVCNTVLTIVFLYMLFNNPWAAAMVGLLFGVHPMTVETIPWIGERKTLLATFFAIWSLIFYLRYTRGQGRVSYYTCLAMYFLALMSKPTSTPLPVLMLLLDCWPLNRIGKRAIMEKLPFLVLGGIFAVITIISQERSASILMPSEYSPLQIPVILCHNIVFYLYKIIYPANLSSHYVFPNLFDFTNPMILAGIIGTCILIPLLIFSLRWTRMFLVGWLYFFIAMLPTMQILGFSNVIAADKFAYLPAMGLLMVLTWLIIRFWTTGAPASRPGVRYAVTMVAVLILTALEVSGTRRYLVHWQQPESQYLYMLRFEPDSPKLLTSLGAALLEQGKIVQAEECYKKALQVAPEFYATHYNMGLLRQNQDRFDEAIQHYKQTLRNKPDFSQARNNLAIVLAKKGDIKAAMAQYRQAAKTQPDSPYAHYNLANILFEEGRIAESIELYRSVVRIRPDFAEGHYNLASALMRTQQAELAIYHFEKSLELNPDHPAAHYHLGNIYAAQGRVYKAIEQYQEMLKLAPDNAEAYNGLAFAMIRLGEIDQALEHCQQSLSINPDSAVSHNIASFMYARKGMFDRAIHHLRESIRLEPNNPDAHCELGAMLVQQNQIDQATAELKTALKLNPQHPKATSFLNQILKQTKPTTTQTQ